MKKLNAVPFIASIILPLACGKTIRSYERQPDPDTLEAIKRTNMETLEGEWTFEESSRRLYFQFHDDSYTALVWDGDVLKVSDQGDIEHYLPGKILLHSTNTDCSAGPREYTVFNFDRTLSTSESLHMVDTKSDRFLTVQRSEALDIPPRGICLWDGNDGPAIPIQ